eukprot:TRINITY_DN36505_c0_g1_i2.p2 TRINITY_DN36505_c0_g1~~TRINITY_DN36505_c0_g1_i2.p2  ORF type:complete len:162 (-),score=42.77 TRINITY_DN36505_c0_g1_i2:245-730(-)
MRRVLAGLMRKKVPVLIVSWDDASHSASLVEAGGLNPVEAELCLERLQRLGGAERKLLGTKLFAEPEEILQWKSMLRLHESAVTTPPGHPHLKARLTANWAPSIVVPLAARGGGTMVPELDAYLAGLPEDDAAAAAAADDPGSTEGDLVQSDGPQDLDGMD